MNRLIFFLVPAFVLAFAACSKEKSFETGFYTPANGTLKDTLGDCDSMVVNGVYTEGEPLTSAHTVRVMVNVTVPGSYRIATDTINGYSFIDSGFFAAPGMYFVTLTGKGTPILPITSEFIVTFGASFCSFQISVGPGTTSGNPNDADTAWMFDESTLHFQGHVDSALFKGSLASIFLNIYGQTATNDTTVFIQLQQTTPTPTGSYETQSGMAVFEFKTGSGATIYDSRQGDGSNMVFTITNYNTSTKLLEGVFSGNANDDGGSIKAITGGKFKIQVQ